MVNEPNPAPNPEQARAEAAWITRGMKLWVLSRMEQGDRGDETASYVRLYLTEEDAKQGMVAEMEAAGKEFEGSDQDWDLGLADGRHTELTVDAGVVIWTWDLTEETVL